MPLSPLWFVVANSRNSPSPNAPDGRFPIDSFRGDTTRTRRAGRQTPAMIGHTSPRGTAASDNVRPPAPRHRLRGQEHTRGVASSNRALHAQPGRERNLPEHTADIRQIRSRPRRSHRRQHEVERFQCAIGLMPRPVRRTALRVPGVASADRDPQQSREIHAGCGGRCHIQPIERVDKYRQLAALGRRCHQLQQQCHPAG